MGRQKGFLVEQRKQTQTKALNGPKPERRSEWDVVEGQVKNEGDLEMGFEDGQRKECSQFSESSLKKKKSPMKNRFHFQCLETNEINK
ncbi:hypothetical protein ASPWEDRAFT_362253 [Aspergillus wentii DTO 134E9]|uniref:Uncharacterized protein n=1 Tax=Aspergillus wentii DTO 134E9 TaxID=1073089 RepID=A0A1L9RWK3_ASPWE|nr:uncharacterized protein ASPWEDRAFT_362253 [Aspergillus wentii DTO 134E9]OJJ39218.1 hypothetical protein ASPWEDRAFT_362253 [Aspergillus wentii DTO 134E9]